MDINSLLILFAVTFWFAEARVISLREPRLSLAEGYPNYYFRSDDGVSNTYMFGYDSDNQYRNEERFPNGTVIGSYGYIGPNGIPYKYNYIADEKGYRVMKDRSSQNQQNNNMGQSNMNQNQFQQNTNKNQQNNFNQNDWYQNQQNILNGNQYQPNYNSQSQYQQNSNMYQQNIPKGTTEDSITWSRPKKQKNKHYYRDNYLSRTVQNRITSEQNGVDPTFSYVPMLRNFLR